MQEKIDNFVRPFIGSPTHAKLLDELRTPKNDENPCNQMVCESLNELGERHREFKVGTGKCRLCNQRDGLTKMMKN